MAFKGIQRTFNFQQINTGSIDRVFPLLCPVREKDWLDGWDYQMVHSISGLIEKDCVFTTNHHSNNITIWDVTQYDPVNHMLEFLRVTPSESVVRINIYLEALRSNQTKANINYQFTALSEDQNDYINDGLEESFLDSMHWWEKAINHYLRTGNKLMKNKAE